MALKKFSLMRDKEQIFHRQDLAEDLAERLQDPMYKSGLFLSAPRRTGKTTFLKTDLLPMLSEAGAIVIYADLWVQRDINPAKVIIGSIADAILHESGAITKAAKMMGLTKVKVGGLEIDLTTIGTQNGDSIARTLEKLSTASKKPIVMVIDEAQHAQTTEEGRSTLFALKAARDALNMGEGEGFRLIATGSNSDRLMTLVSSKDQAFYHATQQHLPELDDTYLQWVLANSPLKDNLSLSVLHDGFDIFSRRPEPLQALLKAVEKDKTLDALQINAVFVGMAGKAMEVSRQTFMTTVESMDMLDAAMFRRMALLGNKYTAFNAQAVAHYIELMAEFSSVGSGSTTGQTPEKIDPPTASAMQNALERLRKDSLVWSGGRGQWFIEDSQHVSWVLQDLEDRERLKRAHAEKELTSLTANKQKDSGPQDLLS